MTSIVSMKGVAKAYVRGKQRVEVLRGIDLDVEQGEFLALMGPLRELARRHERPVRQVLSLKRCSSARLGDAQIGVRDMVFTTGC